MPKLGDKSTCKSCGEPIEYIGPYWRHTDSTPRHPAVPKMETEMSQCCTCGYKLKHGHDGSHSCSDHLSKEIEKLVEALEFYADPDSYFSIGFFPDRPCGDFINDFSDDHGFNQYDRAMPGKLARQVLKEVERN